MQLASIKPNDLTVVKNDSFIPLGEILAQQRFLARGASMIDLITQYDSLKGSVADAITKGTAMKADPRQLKAPVERPSKIWAAAANFERGTTGLGDTGGRGESSKLTPEQILEMTFLKPSSAVIGPEQAILLPKGDRKVFPELEVCIVIGKEARNLSKDQAFDAVFGYTVILDLTARGPNPPGMGIGSCRSVRKGFETFAPIGPWITTRDEIPDPQDLTMRLQINGELIQSAKTSGMINGVADLVSFLSQVTTLYPGDLIATGNPDSPAFQKQLKPGDILKAEIEKIGTLGLTVRNAD